jgi:hypothetical protein
LFWEQENTGSNPVSYTRRFIMPIMYFFWPVFFTVLTTAIIVYDNLEWQRKLHKELGMKPKKKLKLKKGQSVILSVDDNNPFEVIKE